MEIQTTDVINDELLETQFWSGGTTWYRSLCRTLLDLERCECLMGASMFATAKYNGKMYYIFGETKHNNEAFAVAPRVTNRTSHCLSVPQFMVSILRLKSKQLFDVYFENNNGGDNAENVRGTMKSYFQEPIPNANVFETSVKNNETEDTDVFLDRVLNLSQDSTHIILYLDRYRANVVVNYFRKQCGKDAVSLIRSKETECPYLFYKDLSTTKDAFTNVLLNMVNIPLSITHSDCQVEDAEQLVFFNAIFEPYGPLFYPVQLSDDDLTISIDSIDVRREVLLRWLFTLRHSASTFYVRKMILLHADLLNKPIRKGSVFTYLDCWYANVLHIV